MAKKFNAPTGSYDMLREDHTYFSFIKKVIRHRFRQAGFGRISPPIFEESEAFARSLGANTAIINRELYSFTDRTEKQFSLRPEITTGVVRAFIQHKMYEEALPTELYYIEPCFRFERPNHRTRRQFWQFGAEILGESDPSIDAQIIYLGHQILEDLQVGAVCELNINTLGSEADRDEFFESIANFYAGKERNLSPVSREKLEQKKYLELLTPQNEDEQILLDMGPKITDFLNPDSKKDFDQVLKYLDSFGIPYKINPGLIRPINYYSKTIFEFHEKGTQNKILVGGHYDQLIEKMGGPDMAGTGFSAGIERIIDLMKLGGISVPDKDYLQIFLAATGPTAKEKAFPLLVKLRKHGFHAVGVLGRTNMSDQLARAQKFKVPFTILMGDTEVKKEEVIIRNMKTGKQEWIPLDDLIPKMDQLLGVINPLDTSKDLKIRSVSENSKILDTTEDFLNHE